MTVTNACLKDILFSAGLIWWQVVIVLYLVFSPPLLFLAGQFSLASTASHVGPCLGCRVLF